MIQLLLEFSQGEVLKGFVSCQFKFEDVFERCRNAIKCRIVNKQFIVNRFVFTNAIIKCVSNG